MLRLQAAEVEVGAERRRGVFETELRVPAVFGQEHAVARVERHRRFDAADVDAVERFLGVVVEHLDVGRGRVAEAIADRTLERAREAPRDGRADAGFEAQERRLLPAVAEQRDVADVFPPEQPGIDQRQLAALSELGQHALEVEDAAAAEQVLVARAAGYAEDRSIVDRTRGACRGCLTEEWARSRFTRHWLSFRAGSEQCQRRRHRNEPGCFLDL